MSKPSAPVKKFGNAQKNQAKRLNEKECSACGARGALRGSCEENRNYCHSYAPGCCDEKHLVGSSKFPCGVVCSLCKQPGHQVSKCRERCNRCVGTSDHFYQDENYPCGSPCQLCEKVGHDQTTCKKACRTRACEEHEPHLFKADGFPCGEKECGFCHMTNHVSAKCKRVCRQCSEDHENHLFKAAGFPCSSTCSLCSGSHPDEHCGQLCTASWCDGHEAHKFGTEQYRCGRPCSVCGVKGHVSEKCKRVCRSRGCPKTFHVFKTQGFPCSLPRAAESVEQTTPVPQADNYPPPPPPPSAEVQQATPQQATPQQATPQQATPQQVVEQPKKHPGPAPPPPTD